MYKKIFLLVFYMLKKLTLKYELCMLYEFSL